MARVFSGPPEGLNYDTFSGSVPNGMLYRIKSIEGLSKQVIKMTPTSGSTSAQQGNKIIVSLPMNSLLDLSTFEWYFYARTNHAGSTVGGPTGYVRVRYLPKNIQSLIEQLEIKINGKSIQNIPQYNYIYNLLADWVTNSWDSSTKSRIGQNADPSNKAYFKNGRVLPKRGFPVGFYGDGSTGHEESFRDADNYCVRNWLGLLSGGSSTQIIHTDMYGQIDIEITLANAGILMLGVDPGSTTVTALTATAATATVPAYNVSGFTDSVNLASQGTPATAITTAVSAESPGYSLSNIGFSIIRYDMPAPFYEAMRNVLTSGAVYRLYYPNYSIFQGIGTTSKSGTTRFSITTKSLDYVIGTFQIPSRDTITVPLNSVLSTRTQLEYGNSYATVGNQIISGQPLTFNSSKYFVRNGSGITQSTWIVGNVRLPPQTPLEDFNSVLKAFGTKNDINGGLYPGCKNLADFIQCYYGSVLSLQAVGENDLFTISGLDSSQQPVSIA